MTSLNDAETFGRSAAVEIPGGCAPCAATASPIHCALTAKNGTSVLVKGFFLVPGLGKIPFGADNDRPGCFLATPERPTVEIDVPLPAGDIDLSGKGIGAELQFIPGAWGRNLPLDADLTAIEIR